MRRIHVIDSHTGGEPTRVVISGGPPLGKSSMKDRLECFRSRYDDFRSAVVNEPRGSNAMVGALLCEPVDPACAAGVIFFNNVGYLNMCGHGTIGLGATLAYLGRIAPGRHTVETPVGLVGLVLHAAGEVAIENVASYRSACGVELSPDGLGVVVGDVAWGGNWFFLAPSPCEIDLANLERVSAYAWAIRRALRARGITGDDGGEIDHIELFGKPRDAANHGRNFVLCPGGEYDRSPCGTGTSAKLACLHADNLLRAGQVWRQEGILGTVFEGSILVKEGRLYPSITGSAFVNGDANLIVQERDPFGWGIRA